MDIYKLIGDIELFRLVLDGFFKDWKGTYDILPFESEKYVFYSKKGFSRFCKTLRNHPKGDRLCLNCDQYYALETAEEGHVIDYLCHAGLIDIAAPIMVNGRCLATVFCGQRRPVHNIENALHKVSKLETELELPLVELWRKVKPISEKEMEKIKEKLANLTRYLSEQWKDKIELDQAKRNLALRVAENETARTAFKGLSGTFEKEVLFWEALKKVVSEICDKFEVIYGAFLDMKGPNVAPTLKFIVNLPDSLLGLTYPGDQMSFQELINNREPRVIKFNYSNPGTLSYDIADWLTSVDIPYDHPDEVAQWPIYFGDDHYGILCLFAHKEKEKLSSLSIEEKLHILEPFIGQISSAYMHSKLSQREREYANLQSKWIQDVIHEVQQPIHGIMGYAELWRDDLLPILGTWPESIEDLTFDVVSSLHNELESILWMTINASQIARNFAWIAEEKGTIALSIDYDLSGTLIACARDKQGQAKEKGVIGPSVATETIAPFDGRVRLNKDLFKQAMRNLLDNAVKYADKGTSVNVKAVRHDSYLIIQIIDIGMRILPGEEESIFERRTRSALANASNVGGAGIGLSIAREIIELHNGRLRTYPSKLIKWGGRDQYETVFEVILPLINA